MCLDVLYGAPIIGSPISVRLNMTPLPPGPDMATTWPITMLPGPPFNMAVYMAPGGLFMIAMASPSMPVIWHVAA